MVEEQPRQNLNLSSYRSVAHMTQHCHMAEPRPARRPIMEEPAAIRRCRVVEGGHGKITQSLLVHVSGTHDPNTAAWPSPGRARRTMMGEPAALRRCRVVEKRPLLNHNVSSYEPVAHMAQHAATWPSPGKTQQAITEESAAMH